MSTFEEGKKEWQAFFIWAMENSYIESLKDLEALLGYEKQGISKMISNAKKSGGPFPEVLLRIARSGYHFARHTRNGGVEVMVRIYRAMEHFNVPIEVMALAGSFGDTLTDHEIVELMDDYLRKIKQA